MTLQSEKGLPGPFVTTKQAPNEAPTGGAKFTLTIALGVPAKHGLYTAIIAGASVAVFGGCKVPR